MPKFMNSEIIDGNLENVKILYEKRGYFTVSALIYAIEYDHFDIVKYIMNNTDKSNYFFGIENALIFAMKEKKINVINYLINEKKCLKDIKINSNTLNKLNEFGFQISQDSDTDFELLADE